MDETKTNPVYHFLITESAPASTAVDRFAIEVETIVETEDDDHVESALWNMWTNLIKAISITAGDQERNAFVDFLRIIQQRVGPLKKNGERPMVWGHPVEWSALSLLGPSVREFYDICTPAEGQSPAPHAWTALNGYLAQVTLLSSHAHVFDFSLYAIWALRSALEEKSDHQSLKVQSILVRGAAVWMEECPELLFQKCIKSEAFSGGLARAGNNVEGKDWTGFCIQRWNFWAQRFCELEDSALDFAAKVSAKRIARRMEDMSSKSSES